MHSNRRCCDLALMLGLIFLLALTAAAQKSVSVGQPTNSVTVLDSTKQQDGLAGSVRRVKIEFALLEPKSGRIKEGPLQLLEVTTYALNGDRIENVTYPVASSPVGKEEYRYDAKGNIVEMTLRADDGSIVSREAYEYEFDGFGNWKKMVTSLVVFEGGELRREPVEVTYRTLTYYFDDAVAGIIDARSGPTSPALPRAALNIRSLTAASEAVLPPSLNVNVPAVLIDLSAAPPELPRREETVSQEAPANQESFVNRSEAVLTDTINGAAKTIHVGSDAPSAKPVGAERVGMSSANSADLSNTAFVLYMSGRTSIDSGDPKGAVRAYLESLKLEPKSPQVNLSLGHAYITLKKPHEAIKAFKQAIALDPDLAEAHYGLGLNYYQLNRTRDAANAFKRATSLQPDMAKAHFGLALAYQELGNDSGLMEAYRLLQRVDKSLARKLEQTFPNASLPCPTKPFCR